MGGSTAESPVITIGMLIYNGRHYIDVVLNSVYNEDYPEKNIKTKET
jgi:hypothetical protein